MQRFLQSFLLSTLLSTILGVKMKQDVEEFINHLISSDTLDILADKIAVRAADKIVSIQRDIGEKDQDKRDSSEDIKKKTGIDKLNKLISIPAESLSLNYRHFTTAPNKKNKDGDAILKQDKKYIEVKKESLFLPRVHSSEENDTDSNTTTNSNVTTIASKSTEINVERKNSGKISLSKPVTNKEKPLTTPIDKIKDSNVEKKGDRIIGEKRKENRRRNYRGRSKKSSKRSYVDIESDVESKSDESSDLEESDDNRVTESDQEKPRNIREENGKLYAYRESPDYEEYHEKFDKILKSVKRQKIRH